MVATLKAAGEAMAMQRTVQSLKPSTAEKTQSRTQRWTVAVVPTKLRGWKMDDCRTQGITLGKML
jgi:hypothetical protein